MKKISAGIIITDFDNILLGHSTGNTHWDIPKGMVEFREGYQETAIRETNEEFGLDFSNHSLIDLGLTKYMKHKDLYLFLAIVEEMPNPNDCKCDSYFERHGKKFPEIDDYKIFALNESCNHVTYGMALILNKLNLEMNFYGRD